MDKRLNILVVDDEQIVLDSVKRHLRKCDCELFTVMSVKEGLNILDTEKIDIILTDLMMPEIDGLEFMKIVNDKYSSIPIIMITGYATINTALQATQLGAFDYIAKPFSKKELMSVIERASDMVKDTENGGGHTVQSLEKDINLIQSSGDYHWMLLDKDSIIVLGIRENFLKITGDIKSIHLPSVGDEVRQGGSFIQIVSTEKKSFSVLSPLSGVVVAINEEVRNDPSIAAEDPYGRGWMIRMKPTRLEAELKFLGY